MGDKMARALTGLSVLMVAVFAAVVSYSHIYDLARLHGESGIAARLLPLSVDGLILAASLVLLHEARNHRAAPGLARAGLVLGVLATVAANVMYGVGYGIVGAVISAWPAVAFVMASEIGLTQIRRAGGVPTREAAAETVAAVPGNVPSAAPVGTPSPAPTIRPGTVSATRARGRARSKQPEHVFASEIEAGELPSLRTVKAKMRVGTDRARTIRKQLQAAMSGQEVTADV